MAVKDYQDMYPDEYQVLIKAIEQQKHSLKDEYAELGTETHHIKRGLFTVSEKLSAMIGLKLNEEERSAFTEMENARWFADEFPQFRLTKNV